LRARTAPENCKNANPAPLLDPVGLSPGGVNTCHNWPKWILKYFIDFFGEAPYNGAARLRSNNNVVSLVVGGSAERGDVFEYDVAFEDGGELDPRIVVD
jgi:hypothetical protein